MKVFFYLLTFISVLAAHNMALAEFADQVGFSVEGVNVSELEIPVDKEFDVLDTRTGKEKKISPSPRNKIRIIGQNNWAYKIRHIRDGVESPKVYLVTKKWGRRAFNIMAVAKAEALMKEIEAAGAPPLQKDCPTIEPTKTENKPKQVVLEDLLDPSFPEKVILSKDEWKQGCEVLVKGKNVKEEDANKLFQCIRSIQLSLAYGARSEKICDPVSKRRHAKLSRTKKFFLCNGKLNRSKVFRNVFARLRPEEQDFAMKIFTAQGEVGNLAADANYQEMMAVIKVMDNRVRNANTDKQNRRMNRPFNAAHIALDAWQFSMYNEDETLWSQMIDPGYATNFSDSIRSYIQYQTADFEPDPEIEHVYHYHANYVLPSNKNWGSGFRANNQKWEIPVKVNGKQLRQKSERYDEQSRLDRSKIRRRQKYVRHRFYLPLDNKGKISQTEDNWLRPVSIPWD